uniref:Uncharacterized protein n=1 Tax=Arundo donax TaxID=35708 RepID=A0A0A9DNV7_ARUDO
MQARQVLASDSSPLIQRSMHLHLPTRHEDQMALCLTDSTEDIGPWKYQTTHKRC